MTQRIGLGIALAIASTTCFALLDTVPKHVGLLVPLLITLLAPLLLREQASHTTWLLVLINASYQNLTSRTVCTEDPGTMHFITGLICLTGALALVPAFWVQVTDPLTWLLIGLMGVFGSLGHYVMIQACQCDPSPR